MSELRACPTRPPAVWSFDRLSVDLSDCSLLEISIALLEHETAGIRPETWPGPVQHLAARELDSWVARNPNRVVRLISFAATRDTVNVALHHAARKQEKDHAASGQCA